MSVSLFLMTAGLVAGQGTYVPAATNYPYAAPAAAAVAPVRYPAPVPGTPVGYTTPVGATTAGYTAPGTEAGGYVINSYEEPRRGLIGRLRSRIRGEGEVVYGPPSAAIVSVGGVAVTGEPPMAAPAAPAIPALEKKYKDQAGAADDYSWITGQLFAIHSGEGTRWVLRYAPVEQVDKYGGSVVLAPAVEMKNYREGDLVCVDGSIISDAGAPGYPGKPLYRVNSISMITRADPYYPDHSNPS